MPRQPRMVWNATKFCIATCPTSWSSTVICCWGGCDGVLAKMQDALTLSQIPIVVLIANADEEHERLSNPSVVAWMQKPFQLRETLDQLTWAVAMFRPEGGLTLTRSDRMRCLSQ